MLALKMLSSLSSVQFQLCFQSNTRICECFPMAQQNLGLTMFNHVVQKSGNPITLGDKVIFFFVEAVHASYALSLCIKLRTKTNVDQTIFIILYVPGLEFGCQTCIFLQN